MPGCARRANHRRAVIDKDRALRIERLDLPDRSQNGGFSFGAPNVVRAVDRVEIPRQASALVLDAQRFGVRVGQQHQPLVARPEAAAGTLPRPAASRCARPRPASAQAHRAPARGSSSPRSTSPACLRRRVKRGFSCSLASSGRRDRGAPYTAGRCGATRRRCRRRGRAACHRGRAARYRSGPSRGRGSRSGLRRGLGVDVVVMNLQQSDDARAGIIPARTAARGARPAGSLSYRPA